MGLNTKREIVENSEALSITKQCEMLSLNRSSFYAQPEEEPKDEKIKIMHSIDQIYTEYPFYGHRRIWDALKEKGFTIGRDRTLEYMSEMGLQAFYPRRKKFTSLADKAHKKYPYLLKGLKIIKSNQVWAADITYVPLNGRFCYLIIIVDWFSRMILSYRISNSLDVQFCLEALEEALKRFGQPEIFNTNQGAQFTSNDFVNLLLSKNIQISMDSKGRAIDNVIVERSFRTIKYEDIYLKHYESILEFKTGFVKYMDFYNRRRKHSSLDNKTPLEIYYGQKISFN